MVSAMKFLHASNQPQVNVICHSKKRSKGTPMATNAMSAMKSVTLSYKHKLLRIHVRKLICSFPLPKCQIQTMSEMDGLSFPGTEFSATSVTSRQYVSRTDPVGCNLRVLLISWSWHCWHIHISCDQFVLCNSGVVFLPQGSCNRASAIYQ